MKIGPTMLSARCAPDCHFISLLPREIRFQILSYLLASEPTDVFPERGLSRQRSLYPAILYTCKLLELEGTQILYGNLLIIDVCEATIPIPSGFPIRKWCNDIGRNATIVRKIRLYGRWFQPVAPIYYDLSLKYVLFLRRTLMTVGKRLNKLRILEIQPTMGTYHIWVWGQNDEAFCSIAWYLWNSGTALAPERWREPTVRLFDGCEDLDRVTILPVEGEINLDEDDWDSNSVVFLLALEELLTRNDRGTRRRRRVGH